MNGRYLPLATPYGNRLLGVPWAPAEALKSGEDPHPDRRSGAPLLRLVPRSDAADRAPEVPQLRLVPTPEAADRPEAANLSEALASPARAALAVFFTRARRGRQRNDGES
jgi:hypothetical protein